MELESIMELKYGSDEWVEHVLTYQPCNPEQDVHYDAIRKAAVEFMKTVLAHTPKCADQSATVRLIREARMTANAAIALNGII